MTDAAPVRVVLATHNRHKVQELRRILGPDLGPIELVAYDGPEPVEDGATFEENALIKARAAARHTGLPAIADDSGIEAAALGGVPGVRSARYAGEAATDEQNLTKLIGALEGAGDRRVRYVAELVAIAPGGAEVTARGELAGTLAHTPRGTGGFGYDPAFVPVGESRTVAEMSPEEKDAISHRARAARALLAQLRGQARNCVPDHS